MTFKQLFTSSIGKKIVMAFTGFFLITYLIVHAAINALIFFDDGGKTFDTVASFMLHNYIVRILEVGLFLGFILHIVQGLMLWKQNKAARKIGYQKQKYISEITWNSRLMGWLGTFILLFLVMHLSQFWAHTKDELYFHGPDINLYEQMKKIFTNPVWFVLYMIGLASLLFHLLHGFHSAFETFGVNNKRWTPVIRGIGVFYSVVICLLFASMPLAFMVGWLQ
ncbi:MAG TPA: succinate dehydrogenase cytochrome b subunit [Hanamia sp.]|nr:succinate dehydrogenase cytochrome b subunit [Hanamia sp.]